MLYQPIKKSIMVSNVKGLENLASSESKEEFD